MILKRTEMPTILITTSSFGNNNPNLLRTLAENGISYQTNPYGRKLNETEVSLLISQHQPVGMIAGIEPLTKNVLHKAKNLKVISRCGIGLDSVDLKAAKELGISVTNTPDAPTFSVAELTLGMILTILRRIHLSDAGIRKDSWQRPMGSLLHGKTIGIIGCGRIGTYLAKLLSPFRCNVLGYDVVQRVSDLYKSTSLKEILNRADIVTLHLPYSSENHHFMNKARIKIMKQGAILVNASRGGLVDEAALYEALKTAHLGGAALDCFQEEPYRGPLKELDSVLLTAHIGSYTKEGRIMMERQAVENLLLALQDKGVMR